MSTNSFLYVIAKYSYTAQSSQELDLVKNCKYLLLDDSKHWWRVQNVQGQSGYVPSNYVKREKGGGASGLFDSIKKKVTKSSSSTGGSKTLPSSPTHHQHHHQQISYSPTHNNSSGGGMGYNGNGISHTNGNSNNFKNSVGNLPPSSLIPISTATAKYTYTAQQLDEISLVKGSRVLILEKSNDGWWKGRNEQGAVGWFPSNYTEEEGSGGGLSGGGGSGTLGGNCGGDSHTYSVAESNCVLDIMVGVYDFTAENSSELSFCKGDRLEIISRPTSDPDWYKARNSSGAVGLVPRNYLQELSEYLTQPLLRGGGGSIDQSNGTTTAATILVDTKALFEYPWYFGRISRAEGEEVLERRGVDGDFLVRESETNAGDFSISLKAPGRNKHFRIHVENGHFCIGQRKFLSLEQLVEHYQRAPIYTNGRGEKLYLVRGVPK